MVVSTILCKSGKGANGDAPFQHSLFASPVPSLVNNNGVWEGPSVDKVISNCGVGLPNVIPVVGDWYNTGVTRIGVFNNGTWYLGMNGNGVWDGPNVDKVIPDFGKGLPGAIPVVVRY